MTTTEQPHIANSTNQKRRLFLIFSDFLLLLAVLHFPFIIILSTEHTTTRIKVYFGSMLGLSTFGALHAMCMALKHSNGHENVVRSVYHGIYMFSSFFIVFAMLESSSLPTITVSRDRDRSIIAAVISLVLTSGHVYIYKFTMSATAKVHSDNPEVPASEVLFSQLSDAVQWLCLVIRGQPKQPRINSKRVPEGEPHEPHELQGKTLAFLSQMGLRRPDPRLNEDLKSLLQSEDDPSYV